MNRNAAIMLMCTQLCTSAAAAPSLAPVPGWHSYHDPGGFSISYPPGWKTDPKFADLDYPDNNGRRARIPGLGLAPGAALQPGTTLADNSPVLAVERLPAGKAACLAMQFLVQPPPDHSGGVVSQSADAVHAVSADPGDWYSYEDYIYRVSLSPCLAVHYFISYRTPGGELAAGLKPYDKPALLSLLDRIRASLVLDKR